MVYLHFLFCSIIFDAKFKVFVEIFLKYKFLYVKARLNSILKRGLTYTVLNLDRVHMRLLT